MDRIAVLRDKPNRKNCGKNRHSKVPSKKRASAIERSKQKRPPE
jgi:hypothetical protein